MCSPTPAAAAPPAYDFPAQVHEREKQARSREMNALAEEIRREVLAAHVGTEDEVLLETPLSETLFTGYHPAVHPGGGLCPRPQERRDRSRQAGRVRWRARPCSTLLKKVR